MERPEKFNHIYLVFREGRPDMIAEIPANRYMPHPTGEITEHLVQFIWKNSLFRNSGLHTTTGQTLHIFKAGRLNKGPGPDFKNASFSLNGETVIGDVEIHVNAQEWHEHKHRLSARYDNTKLHVFLHRTSNTPQAFDRLGKPIPELELAPYMVHTIENLQMEMCQADRPITGRSAPNTPCGRILAKAGPDTITTILSVIGDGRMIIKSNRILSRLEDTDPAQVLYELIFECLGYSRFNGMFGKLSRYIKRHDLLELFKENSGESPPLIAQAVFFFVSSLEETAYKTSDDPELQELLARYKKIEKRRIEHIFNQGDWNIPGCRPANFPHRRIAAFSHLVAEKTDWKTIGDILSSLPLPATDKEVIKVISRLAEHFSSISDSFWEKRYNFNSVAKKATRLIGKDRVASLIVDCVIPFYLAVARREDNRLLEKRLALIFRNIPKTSSNAILDFMSRNMLEKNGKGVIKSARHQQALLQLYTDFCHKAPAGCVACHFPSCLGSMVKYLENPLEKS